MKSIRNWCFVILCAVIVLVPSQRTRALQEYCDEPMGGGLYAVAEDSLPAAEAQAICAAVLSGEPGCGNFCLAECEQAPYDWGDHGTCDVTPTGGGNADLEWRCRCYWDET
jgi:hypothetical protein